MVQNLRCLTVVVDGEGTIVDGHGDPEFSAGYRGGDLVGRHVLDFVAPEQHNDIADIFLSTSDDDIGMFDHPQSFTAEVMRADGGREVFDVLARGVTFDGGGSGWVVMLVSHDDQPTPHELTNAIVDGESLDRVAAALVRSCDHRNRSARQRPYVVVRVGVSFEVVTVIDGDPVSRVLRELVRVRDDWLWEDLPADDVASYDLSSVPAGLAAAAREQAMAGIHAGRVVVNGDTECMVVWLVSHPDVTPLSGNVAVTRRLGLRLLKMAARREATERVLRAAARIDQLTGLANQASFRETLDELDDRPATVVFIDLDRFKQVNDRWGHQVGDEVLAEVGERLRAACRPEDTVARIGGDEFAVVFEGTGRSAALAASNRLLESIRAPLPPGLGPEAISASIGVVYDTGDLAARERLARADLAMLSGKRAGRDRIVAR